MTAAESEQVPSRRETGAKFDEMAPDSTGTAKPTVSRRQLSLLGLVVLCAAGVGFASFKSGPRAANGSTAVVAPAASQIGEFIAGDAAAALEIRQLLHDAQAMGDRLRFSPASTQVPVTDLKTNPFRLAGTSGCPVEIPDDSTDDRGTEQQREDTLQAVQSLRLQSILRGDSHRACLIDGVLYQEGDVVEGFIVEEIALNTVVVRKDMYRFELQMRK